VSTRRSIKSEGIDLAGIEDAGGRKPSNSKSEFVEGSSSQRLSVSPSSLRQQRPRTTSTSLQEIHTSMTLLYGSSQEALENVITSRLVETRLVITVFYAQPDPGAPPEKTATQVPSNNGKGSTSPKGGVRRSTRPSLSVQEKATFRRESTTSFRFSSPRTAGTVKAVNHVKSASTPSFRQPEVSTAGAPAQGGPVKSDKGDKSPPSEGHTTYISPIHHPSTNPTFSFDVNLLDDNPLTFVGHKLKLEVWGRSENNINVGLRDKGKDKQRESNVHPAEWKVIDGWFIDLEKLIPLTEEVHFPHFTLMTLIPDRISDIPSS
jgi:hypothetical protein